MMISFRQGSNDELCLLLHGLRSIYVEEMNALTDRMIGMLSAELLSRGVRLGDGEERDRGCVTKGSVIETVEEVYAIGKDGAVATVVHNHQPISDKCTCCGVLEGYKHEPNCPILLKAEADYRKLDGSSFDYEDKQGGEIGADPLPPLEDEAVKDLDRRKNFMSGIKG